MTLTLRLALACGVVLLLLIVLYMLHKQRFNLKYSLIWLLLCACMVCVILFPGTIDTLGQILGIKTPVNTVFLIILLFILLLLISLTAIVTHMQKKIKVLVQHVGIVEKKIEELKIK